jgi:hypothetical protein
LSSAAVAVAQRPYAQKRKDYTMNKQKQKNMEEVEKFRFLSHFDNKINIDTIPWDWFG